MVPVYRSYGGQHLRRDGCFGLDYAVGNQKRKGGEEMNQLFQDSVFFGVLISLAAYGIGMLLKLKTGWSLMNIRICI